MFKILFIRDGVSNKPEYTIDINTTSDDAINILETVSACPGKYRVQINADFLFIQTCSFGFHSHLKPKINAFKFLSKENTFTENSPLIDDRFVVSMISGFVQSLAFSMDIIEENEKESENE